MEERACLSCAEVRKLLPEYLNGAANLKTVQHLKWHFGRCRYCRLIVCSAIETLRQNFREDPARIPYRKSHAA